jgi:hypothetical protein
MRFHFYRASVLKEINFHFDDVVTKQDFHMTLSLLEHGYPNVVNFGWMQGQPGSNTDGGCSWYRTPEVMAAGAIRLKELHPDFVRIVEKETLHSWGGGKRLDVNVSWKKALGSKVEKSAESTNATP